MSVNIDFNIVINDSSDSGYHSYSLNKLEYNFDYVDTDYGSFYLAFSKNLKTVCKPVIVTFHDVGQNYKTNFELFFKYPKMKSLLEHFSVVHINAPGQEFFSKNLDPKLYPTFDEMAKGIQQVLDWLSIDEFVGFGVGAGANILTRFALSNPSAVNGLFLVNAYFNKRTWTYSLTSWLTIFLLQNRDKVSRMARKIILRQFYTNSFNSMQLDDSSAYDSEHMNHRHHFGHPAFNMRNFSLFLESCLKRTNLTISRSALEKNVYCPVLLISGELSPTFEDASKMASRLNPATSSFIKLTKGDNILSDHPDMVTDSLQLFMQGLGYIRSYRLMNHEGHDDEETSF